MVAKRTALLAIVVVAVVVIGGVGAYVLMNRGSTGKVSIYVKDLPATWTHVNVTFSEAKIHAADQGNQSGWHNLPLKTNTVDLASLVNVSELLASANVSVGKYTQIRLVVESVTGTMANGTIVQFSVPSGELKTSHPFNVTAGSTTTLTFDIDLGHSIVQNANGWTFKPVLGSITES